MRRRGLGWSRPDEGHRDARVRDSRAAAGPTQTDITRDMTATHRTTRQHIWTNLRYCTHLQTLGRAATRAKRAEGRKRAHAGQNGEGGNGREGGRGRGRGGIKSKVPSPDTSELVSQGVKGGNRQEPHQVPAATGLLGPGCAPPGSNALVGNSTCGSAVLP
jgi:hypothetical protein